ncbi:hypothetical protein SO694_00159055 [Aureococcus anophagefferens]|uniref:Uncharacterized protein n=1 Tax=Aureococcus anophagefferens TaxID=44056 RepID=A0ABR1G294_AURAN
MHAKALELWRRLAAADPDDCVAWYNVGGAAAGLGDVDGALEAYARALAPHCGAALRSGRARRGALCIKGRRPRRRPHARALADFDAAPGGDFPAHALYNLNTALRQAWWLKAHLFSADAGLEGGVLYVDLDTVVCGPLAGLAAYGGDSVALLGTDDLANENRSGGYNSPLMVWTAPALGIYDLVAEPGAYAALSSYVRVKRKTTTIFLNVEKSDSFGGVKQKIGEILDVARRRTRFDVPADRDGPRRRRKTAAGPGRRGGPRPRRRPRAKRRAEPRDRPQEIDVAEESAKPSA